VQGLLPVREREPVRGLLLEQVPVLLPVREREPVRGLLLEQVPVPVLRHLLLPAGGCRGRF
jgi:hypothetical protein